MENAKYGGFRSIANTCHGAAIDPMMTSAETGRTLRHVARANS